MKTARTRERALISNDLGRALKRLRDGTADATATDRVLDLGVATVVGLEAEGVARAVGDERVVVVEDESRELGARRRSHPADDEPDRPGVLLVGERDKGRLGHVGAALEPGRDGRPGVVRERLRSGPVPLPAQPASGDGRGCRDGSNRRGITGAQARPPAWNRWPVHA